MLTYKDYQKAVFDWLMGKHKKDPNFTFSVRKNATKGNEDLYFIGTEKSRYIGTTFWDIPIGYPGSANDLVGLLLMHSDNTYSYKFECKQTTTPHDDQNTRALQLIKRLKPIIKSKFELDYESKEGNKLFTYTTKPKQKSYNEVESMFNDIEKELAILIPLVDREVDNMCSEHPTFKAHRITQGEFDTLIDKLETRHQNYQETEATEEANVIENDKNEYEGPHLNTILYGPPGTGKTYNTILRAAQIITGKTITDYDQAKRIFNEHLDERIGFITFHQNYSYEDFIQGLRPNVENDKNLAFQKIDGVFTQMAKKALFEYYKLAKGKPSRLQNTSEADIDEIYLDFVEHLKKLENPEFKTATGSIVRISEFTKNDNIRLMHQSSSRPYLVSGKRLIKLFHVYPDIDLITNVAADIRGAIGGCNATIYWVMLFEFSEFVRNYQREIEPEEIETDEDLDYDRKRKLLEKANLEELSAIKPEEVPSYVLIIDEINRANISRVFGELITLIELDKRSHGAIPLKCTLPSVDEFIVPSNLYLIGTMNTADKSIALLDIALRRRFVFEGMYPLYEINGEPIAHSEILEKINEQIIKNKGHDFQIGHAYFMNKEESLVQIMNKKVIPLLLEYFMNDKKEVETILTNAGLTLEENRWPIQIAE